ncbi:MAG TPA: dihydrodipicolinate synthase family protein [Bryobacteraceae bacterium]|nr:dihydrodipicolinate synthase family protein [Bryobacteraceae bacterium]
MPTENSIAGVYVAAITPRREEGCEADIGAMLELVDFLCSAGVDGIALLGSTGEFVHFSFSDRNRLIEMAVKRSRVPILAGTSHSTLAGTIELSQAAMAAGAAGLLVMPPYFFRYGQQEIREFYLQLAAAMGKQARIFLYNIPFFTSEIEIETAMELLSTGLFAGIKDSSGNYEHAERFCALAQQHPFTMLAGNDRIFTAARQAGAHGIVSGVACAAPELLVALDRAIKNQQAEEILRLDARLQEFIDWHERFPTPVAIKAATAVRGLKTGPFSTPLDAAGDARLEEFRQWFKSWLAAVQNEAAHA